MARRLVVFQGGGPTVVINATLAGILEGAGQTFDRIYGLTHSLENLTLERWVDLSELAQTDSDHIRETRAKLARTPGAILGSSRNRVSEPELREFVGALRRSQISDVIGIGGNGTMRTLDMLAQIASEAGLPLRIVGSPKTVDNDIPGVEFAPGFGSAARFVATAVRDYDCDFRAMQTFDDVAILETMGRDTGWLAAASVILQRNGTDSPHVVLVPERPVDEKQLIDHVAQLHREIGRVFIVTNEVLTDDGGQMLGANFQDGPTDALGRTMYSLSVGTAHYLAHVVRQQLNLQVRCLRPGNLGRALSGCVSQPDFALAWSSGRQALKLLDHAEGTARMLTIDRDLAFGSQPAVAGTGRKVLPPRYLDPDQPFGIAAAYRTDVASMIGVVEPIFRLEDGF